MKNIILLALLFVMFMGVVYGAMVATGGQTFRYDWKNCWCFGCR